MTAQVPDILRIRGEAHDLCETPLYDYLRRLRRDRRPSFVWNSTACWRGYQATWEVIDGALHLVGLDGIATMGGGPASVTLADVMPWLKPPVKAVWVSGELRCPEGRLLTYRHNQAFGSQYERDRLLFVERGEVRAEWLRVNPPEPLWYEIAPDGTRTRREELFDLETVLDDPSPAHEPPDGRPVWGRPAPKSDDESGYVLGGWYSRGVLAPDAVAG